MTTAGVPALTSSGRPRATSLGRAAEFLAGPRRALCAAVVLLSAAAGLDALGDPDVWWHLLLGQWAISHAQVPLTEMLTYTANGLAAVPHEWLADVGFAAVTAAGGLFLLALLMGAVWWSGVVAIVVRSRLRGAGPVAIAAGVALAAKTAEPVLGTRTQILTFALVCWTLWIADTYLRTGGRRLWLLPPLFLVWANMHGGFAAGLGFLVLIVVAEAAKRVLHLRDRVEWLRIRTLALVTGVAALAACINPIGPALYRFAVVTATTEQQKGIIEWLPPNFADPGLWALGAFLVSFAALAGVAAVRRRLDLRDGVLACAGCVMALLAVRNTSLCVAVAAPVWIASASDLGCMIRRRRAPRRERVTRAAVAMGAIIVALGGGAVAYTAFRVHAAASPPGIAAAYPACAATVLARSPSTQRVFAVYGDAGYIAYRLWPHALVYVYGDDTAIGTAIFQDYYRIAAGAQTSPTAMQLLDAGGTTAVLYPSGPLTAQLARTAGWTHVLSDHGEQLFVRGDASWAAGAGC